MPVWVVTVRRLIATALVGFAGFVLYGGLVQAQTFGEDRGITAGYAAGLYCALTGCTMTGTLTTADLAANGTALGLGNAATDVLTVQATVAGASPLVFEGATANDFETTFAITDPTTPDKTITFPDATLTVNAAADISGTTLAAGVVTSSLTTVGALASGSIATGFGPIDNGANAITTTGALSCGALTATGDVTLGSGTATVVDICNSSTCDTVNISTNADADTINLGDSLDATVNAGTLAVTGATTLTGALTQNAATAVIGVDQVVTLSGGAAGLGYTGGDVTVDRPGIAVTTTTGLRLDNSTAATAGVTRQWSPRLELRGTGWKTASGGASDALVAGIENQVINGTAYSAARLTFFSGNSDVAGDHYQVNGYVDGASGRLTWNYGADFTGSITATTSMQATTTITALGQLKTTLNPADTTNTSASLLVNPTAAGAGEPLLGVLVNGTSKFLVDAEGDADVVGALTVTKCTGTVATDAVACEGGAGVITDDGTDINADATRAAITVTNAKILATSSVTVTQCSARDANAALNFVVVPGSGTATVSIQNSGTGNHTSVLAFCFNVF